MPFRVRIINFLKSTFVGGMFVLAPIVLLLFIIGKTIEAAYSALRPLFDLLPFQSVSGVSLALVSGIVAIIALCFFAGLVAKTALTRRFVRWIESMVLTNLPGYSLMKSVGARLVGAEHNDGREAVIVRFESSSMIGFSMDKLDDGRVLVFVPGAPNAFSGTLHIIEANRIEPLGISVRETLDCLSRLGVETAELLRGRARGIPSDASLKR